MKSRIQLLLTFFAISMVSATAQNYVTLYSDCNYGGTSQMYKAGSYSLVGTRIGKANLSSVRVPAGMKLILYTDANPGNGQKTRITYDISCLTSLGWNDRAYSIAVENEGNATNLPGNTNPPVNNDMATLYEDCNYRGGYSSLSAGYHDWNGLGIRNDQLSSLRLPNGWSITIYENSGFKGRSQTYNSSVSCLPGDWNDRVSSVLISSRGGGNNNNNNNNNNNWNAKVSLYTDCYFRGQSSSLGVGNYNVYSMGINNDAISSLRIPAGLSVRVFSDDNYRGRSATLSSDQNCLGRDWSDQISSLQVFRTGTSGGGGNANDNISQDYVTLFMDDEFRGKSVTLRPGAIANLATVGFGENNLSSIQLPRGWKVVIYDQPNFRGSSYTILRTKANFWLTRWNDRASSMIIYTSGGIVF